MQLALVFFTIITISLALACAMQGFPEYGVLLCFFMSLAFNLLDQLKKE